MPKVRVSDIKQVLGQAEDLFKKESQKTISSFNRLLSFWDAFALAICTSGFYSGKRISGKTLYNLNSKIINATNRKDNLLTTHLNVADALYSYVKRKKCMYVEEYPLATNERRLVQWSIKKISETEATVSQDDITRPEFPVGNPAYPASPHYPLRYKDFKRLWIKDEGHNPTGTHKDRMAWEVIRYYKDKCQSFLKTGGNLAAVPRLSLLSSGNAAIAIQVLLNEYRLPPLKVLIGKQVSDYTTNSLFSLGCEVYLTDLEHQELKSQEIKQLTNNEENGIDVTFGFGHGMETIWGSLYDWLSYEILNQNPDYCIIPFGSGNLFRNVLETLKTEAMNAETSRRFFGDLTTLVKCEFLGASVSPYKPNTCMDKLWAPYNTGRDFSFSPYHGICGDKSRIIEVTEEYALRAMQFASERNINCEPSGIAGLGLFFQHELYFPKDKKILIINTGKARLNNLEYLEY